MSALEKDTTMSAEGVAKYLGIAQSTVYQLPIPYYAYGRKRVYEMKDVEEYKQKCRCVSTKTDAPNLSLTASSTESVTALQSYFQKRGLLGNAKSTTKKKQRSSTHLRVVKP